MHPAEDEVASLARACAIRPGRKLVRAFHQAGKGGALGQRHFARRFVEITAGGCFCTIEPAAEVDSVEIKLEDFLLREMILNSPSHEHLKKLAAKGLPLELETVARQLLSNRARSLSDMAGDGVFQCGANDA